MISAPDRRRAIELIDQARADGARVERACQVLGISLRTYRRWRAGGADARPQAQRPRPANALSEAVKAEIIAVCNEARYRNWPPSQIVPTLADEGRYIASESSFYRVLRDACQLAHRGRSKPAHTPAKPTAYCAAAPNAAWSWDITFMATTVAGVFFHLYLIVDVFSRKIVGWEIHHSERAEHASVLITKACLAEGVARDQLVLHADNGSPMKGATMLATLQRLGVVPSFSRPAVSNDNAFSESLFRTLKSVPSYPHKPFECIEQAREWVRAFVDWYNHQHRHSALSYVTPAQRHNGEDHAVLAQRRALYETAKAQYPERWSGGIRDWSPAPAVYLNPDPEEPKTKSLVDNAA